MTASKNAASSQPLAGRTAVVTGASSGIGRAIAETLGRAGARRQIVARTILPLAGSL